MVGVLFKEVADLHLITSMGAGGKGYSSGKGCLTVGEGHKILKRWGAAYLLTWGHIPEDLNLQQHHCEKVKSHTIHNLFENM